MRGPWSKRVVRMLAAIVACAGCSDGATGAEPEPSTCEAASCAGRDGGTGTNSGATAGMTARAGQGERSSAGEAAVGGAAAGGPATAGGQGGSAASGSANAGAVAAGTGGASAGPSGGAVGGEAGSGAGAVGEAGSGAAAGGGGAGSGGDACVVCAAYAGPTELARVRVEGLNALSGIAVGQANPQLLYAHNDRNRPVVYALDMQGQLRARLTLDTPATDIEDIAVGPCAGGTCIFVADIGDNAVQRAEYAVLRFAEPELPDASSVAMAMPAFDRIRFSYEDGSHNAEGFIVDPGSGKLYVVTKVAEGQPSRVYRIDEPAAAGAAARAVKVADLTVPKTSDLPVSAAAAQPCGRGFVLRTFNTIYEFRIAAGAAFESAFSVAPIALNAPTEPQSEAIDYFPDGSAIVSSGESAGAPIFVTRCLP